MIYGLIEGTNPQSKSLARLYIFFPCFCQRLIRAVDQVWVKIHLASWRHSAGTALNPYRSKVIAGRFYDNDFIPSLHRRIRLCPIPASIGCQLAPASELNSPEKMY
jgi:hypothetical protein